MRVRPRRWVQLAGVLAANPWFVYLGTRTIYQGKAKGVCFPGLNCYACPLALMSCPIGSLQHSLALASPQGKARASGEVVAQAVRQTTSSTYAALLYVVGSIGLVGILTGRLLCGWVCPFGLLQDLLYKIPLPKLTLPRWTRFGKYVALGALAMLLPYITGVSWYSRLCPAGTLEGALPLKALPPASPLPPAGWFFWLKVGILVFFLALMLVSKRPFCRTACALGAALALMTPVSFYRMDVDSHLCNSCGRCREVCPVDINIFDDPNSPECVRCLECKAACPRGAVKSGFRAGLSARHVERPAG